MHILWIGDANHGRLVAVARAHVGTCIDTKARYRLALTKINCQFLHLWLKLNICLLEFVMTSRVPDDGSFIGFNGQAESIHVHLSTSTAGAGYFFRPSGVSKRVPFRFHSMKFSLSATGILFFIPLFTQFICTADPRSIHSGLLMLH